MNSSIQSFIKSLSEVPEGKFPPEYYTPLFIRGFIFGNYAYPSGLIIHALLLLFFALIGETKTDAPSRLDDLYRYAKNLGNLENLEDDFTILEVAFV